MAEAALFIGWGEVVRGREMKALQVFNETQQYYAGLQQAGTIESFETALLSPHGGDLAGFILLRGDQAKLDALRATDEFQRNLVRASLIAANVGVVPAAIGEGLTTGIATFVQAVSELA